MTKPERPAPIHVTFTRSATTYHVIRGKRATPLRRLAHRIRMTLARRKPWHVALKEVV